MVKDLFLKRTDDNDGQNAMNHRELLISGAAELGITLTADQVDSLFVHLAELKKWNRRINLTAITEERDLIIKHLLDSLSYIKGFTPVPGMRLLDMGSGAGFPAIPVKVVCPDISITLVEAVKKKASFLRHILRSISLEAEVLEIRAESVPDSYERAYDLVTARAFAQMGTALRAGMRFLGTNGRMILSRGPEETFDEQDMTKIGIGLEKRLELTLPQSDYRRALWIFKKAG